MKNIKQFINKYQVELIIFIISMLFSTWLMFSTFSYANGNMYIATKAWSDFASHIPLIRSFSLGNNFPTQYPLFAGPPIKYHFLFYAFVGVLEKLGLRIDYALNISSIFGFTFLILTIYAFAKLLFKKNSIALLSILFFIFNGSLSFVKFFSEHHSSKNIFLDIIQSKQFTSFGPYDQSIVSAFWNLNIYTNQRHLALSYALSMLLIYLLIKPYFENKKQNLLINLFVGIIFGLSFFINIAVFFMTGVIFTMLIFFLKNYRKGLFLSIIIGGIIAIPQYLLVQASASSSQILFYPGYLINYGLTFLKFISYWFQNLGLHLILIPLGFLFAPKKVKIVFVSFFSLFLVGNLFRFSPEIAANHKFFNYFMIIGSMFSAYFLYYLWNNKKNLRALIPLIIFILILSGVVDFFPIFNDSKIALADYKNSPDIYWITKNTSPSSIFLNTQYLYDSASIAGRKIFLGWPYFAWSQGYDTLSRDNLRKNLLNEKDLKNFCRESFINKIDYAELNLYSEDAVANKSFFDKNFPLVYKNGANKYYIYKIKDKCI